MPTASSSRRAGWSGRWVRALVLALVLALAATQAVAQETDPDQLADELEQTEQQLEQQRGRQQQLQGRVGSAQEQLEEADRRLVALTAQLREREAELADATARHEEAVARTAEVQERLAEMTANLERVRERLERDEDRFGDRVAASYMYGGSLQMAQVMLTSKDLSELVTTGYYVDSVLREDKSLVDRVSNETRRLAEERREVDVLRDELATQEAVAERAREEVQRATEVQRELTQRVEDQRVERQALLQELESDLATATELVANYEAESARLRDELAQARWQAAAPGPGGLVWPTDGQVGSGYGYRTHPISGQRRLHSGVDISGPTGQPIVSAGEGLVIHSGWYGGYGMAVVVDHGGLATLYAHQSRLLVTEGQVVDAGQQVGEVGSTGYSTGPHLHYEVWVREGGDWIAKNPMDWY